MKPSAIIVDLDRTLSDPGDRDVWDLGSVKNDRVIPQALEIIKRFQDDHMVFIVTARSMSCYVETQQWLDAHLKGWYDVLLMNMNTSIVPDDIVKKEIYQQHIEPSFDVFLVLDDAPHVVKMWRSLGLVCYQVV